MTSWRPDLGPQSGPLYTAIADALARDRESGRLRPGERLPTHRDLARSLGVTVGTVTRAYAEARRRGLAHGEVGRGTFVNPPADEDASFGFTARARAGVIDFSMNFPAGSIPTQVLAEALRRAAEGAETADFFGLQPHTGAPRHRAAGARWVQRRGVRVDPARIVVTTGSQQALLIALATCLDAGDVLLTEEQTFPGLRAAASFLNLRVEGVAMDEQGLLPEALERAARRSHARLVYCVPTLHNPTAATMGAGRRAEILAVAQGQGLCIVEDDPYGHLISDAPPALLSAARPSHFYIAGTTKVFPPGLRVAYLVAPPERIDDLALAMRSTTFCAPALGSQVASTWIEQGRIDELVAARRADARVRQGLAGLFLRGASWRAHPEGYHLWLQLSEPWTAASFVAEAHARGVELAHTEVFHVGPHALPRAVRICLGAPRQRPEVERGLAILRDLLGARPTRSAGIL